MKLAFLGLGTMGIPMATNLLKAGYSLRVWNRSVKLNNELGELQACVVSSPEIAISDADILITMFSDDDATKNIIITSGLIERLKPEAIHINMATISVELADQLTELHQQYNTHYISAPVLGRFNVAQAGALNILAAGGLTILDKVAPIFDVLGQKTWVCGEVPHQANAVKLAINYMIASAISTMGEASTLVQSYDVKKSQFLELITSTIFSAPVYKGYGDAISQDKFEPAGFKLSLGLKDVNLTLQAAEKNNVPMSIASVLRDYHLESLAHQEGHFDWAALYLTNARHAGQEN